MPQISSAGRHSPCPHSRSSPSSRPSRAQARRLRAEGASFAELGRRFGIRHDSVSKRARKEGWVTPGDTAPQAVGGRRVNFRRPSPATADIRRRLALRLYSVIEFRIRMMGFSMQKQLDALEQNPMAPPRPR